MMDLINREEVHDIIAMHLSDYMTDETRKELEELDIKVEEDIPTVQAVPIEVLDKIRSEIEQMNNIDYVEPITVDEVLQIIDKYRAESEQEPKTDSWSIKDVADTFKKHGLIREQEQSGDLISRQAVIDAIKHAQFNFQIISTINFADYKKEVQEIVDNILSAQIKAINDLPSVNPQEPKWIPVSERLPELNRPLLVTAYHRVCYAHMISERGNYGYPVFRLHEIKDSDRGWVQETISHEPYSKGRIDAWMYIDIPEPYKAESEDKE